MEFEVMLAGARAGDKKAMEGIFRMYEKLLRRQSYVHGKYDEDLFQELSETLAKCVMTF